jgi:hypothetical protein
LNEQLNRKPLGVNVSIIYNECNFCIKVTYDIAFFRIPAFTTCARLQKCIPNDPEGPPIPAFDPPDPDNEPDKGCYNCKPLKNNAKGYYLGIWGLNKDKYFKYQYAPGYPEIDMFGVSWGSGYRGRFPLEEFEKGSDWTTVENQLKYNYRVRKNTGFYTKNMIAYAPFVGTRYPWYDEYFQFFIMDCPLNGVVIPNPFYVGEVVGQGTVSPTLIQWDDENDKKMIEQHIFFTNNVGKAFEMLSRRYRSATPKQPSSYYDVKMGLFAILKPEPDKPPIPPEPPERNDMGCCPETNAKLDFIIRKLGLRQLPTKVSENMLSDNPNTVNKESFLDLNLWFYEQIFNLIGEFPLKIQVETDEGDKSEPLSFPNIAEMMAEIYGLLFSTMLDSDASYASGIATLSLLSKVFATSLKTYDLSHAISEYLGHRLQRVEREIELPFNPELPPGSTSQDQLFQPTKHKIASFENASKETAQLYFERLAFAASIIKGVYYNPANADKAAKDAAKLLKEIKTGKKESDEEKEKADFDSWMKAYTTQINLYLKARGMPEIDYDELPPLISNENTENKGGKGGKK